MIQPRHTAPLIATVLLAAACGEVTSYTDAGDVDASGVDALVDPAVDAGVSPDGALDDTPPDTTITDGPDDPSNLATATLWFGADEAATFECRLDGGAFLPCTSPHPVTVTDGEHAFEVRATDGAGNLEPSPARHGWRSDTLAPDTTITAAPAAIDNSIAVSFELDASEAATFECRLDAGAFAPCTSPHPVTGLVDGAHTFWVRAVDLAGNVDASPDRHDWTLDSAMPDTVLDAGPQGDVNVTGATFTFSSPDAGDGATFQCRRDAEPFAPCTSPRVYAGMTEGDHTFAVRVSDAVGNVDPSPATRAWTVDLTAPQTTIDSGPTGAVGDTVAELTFGASEAGATFACRLDDGGFAPCTSPHRYTGLSDGDHLVAVRATDRAGNVDASPATRGWTVDTAAPDTTITAAPASPSNQAATQISFSASEGGVTFACRLDDAAPAPCTSPHALTGLSQGSHTFAVRATDATGHADPSPASVTWTVDTAAPVVATVTSPTSNGRYSVAATIVVQVTFTEAVTVAGTPTLLLETGATDRVATYTGGTGTTTLSFGYTVAAGDSSPDLDYASTAALTGGTIGDVAGNPAHRALAAPGAVGSLGFSRALVIAAAAPVMTGVTVTPATAYTDTTLTCTASASDGDGDAVTFQYAWLRNGATVAGAAASTLGGASFVEGDAIQCRATPSDGAITGAAMTSASVAILNTAPVMTAVTVSPATAYTDTTLTCLAIAGDLDGEAVTFQYAWLRNGIPLAGVTASTLPGSHFVDGDAIQCRATPGDGTASGAAMTSAAVTILNSLPVMTSVVVTPTTAYTTTTLTCTAAASDGDGETVHFQYAWLRNGSVVAGATASTLAGSFFVEANAIQCRATPEDGSDTGAAMTSAAVTIQNSAPTALASVTLTPATPSSVDTLTCTATGGSDPDEGDTIAYRYKWILDGSQIPGQAGPTLPPATFDPGDAIRCEVAATDGTVEGPSSGSNVVTITAPPTCQAVESLSCGQTRQGSTLGPGSSDVLDTYSCNAWNESGREVAYEFKASTSGPATASVTGFGADLDVIVVAASAAGCTANHCVAAGDQGATFTTTAGSTYYVIVDGYGGAEGSYTVSLSCP